MTRVAIIGNAGGGKSTICRRLGKALGLPVYPIDQLQWKPGWIPTSTEEFHEKHTAILAQERWIIDGWGPPEEIEARFQAADTIIFVDHLLLIHYWWALKWQVKCLFRPRPDGPEGCPMLPMTGKLFRMIWVIHHQSTFQAWSRSRKRAQDDRAYLSKYSCAGACSHVSVHESWRSSVDHSL